jgi:hypothetical protein
MYLEASKVERAAEDHYRTGSGSDRVPASTYHYLRSAGQRKEPSAGVLTWSFKFASERTRHLNG